MLVEGCSGLGMKLISLILAAGLSVMVAGCGRDQSPQTTPQPAAEVVEATAPSRVVTTPPQSTPGPTDTALSPTPASTSTPPPTPPPDGLRFHFGPGVDDFDRSLITRAVELTRQLLKDESGVQPPAAVFAYESVAALAEAFSEKALAQSWRAAEMPQRLPQTIAEASYRGIVINTGAQAWKDLDAAGRLRVVAHEFVHVIQLEHAGLEVAEATLSGPNLSAPPAGPFWLLEGSAEVVSWLVLQELNLGSYADALLQYARGSRGAATDLSQMEGYLGFAGADRRGLGLSVLATDYLLRSRSLVAAFEFWKEIGRGATWQTAFIRHFGVPPEFFYQAFADYYKTVWAGVTN